MTKPVSAPKPILKQLVRQLGTCPQCMRQAFLSAALAAVFAVAADLLGAPAILQGALALAAGLLGALWVAHLLAYALRSAGGRVTVARAEGDVLYFESIAPTTKLNRREFVWAALRAFAVAAFVTAIPTGVSRAQTGCTLTSCSDTECTCVAPAPQCVTCPARNEVGCFPSDAVPCCSVHAFWGCLNGTQCYGDGTVLPRCR